VLDQAQQIYMERHGIAHLVSSSLRLTENIAREKKY
jgi:hypothetical protein